MSPPNMHQCPHNHKIISLNICTIKHVNDANIHRKPYHENKCKYTLISYVQTDTFNGCKLHLNIILHFYKAENSNKNFYITSGKLHSFNSSTCFSDLKVIY